MNTLIGLLIFLVVVGVIFWLIVQYVLPAIPLGEPFKRAIVAILALIVIVWLVQHYMPPEWLAIH